MTTDTSESRSGLECYCFSMLYCCYCHDYDINILRVVEYLE